MVGLVVHLMMNCEWNDLVHAPGVLGLCKVKGSKAGQLEVHQPAGRCRRRSIGCGARELPALGQLRQSLPPTLQDLELGLCSQALDGEMDNHTRSRCA